MTLTIRAAQAADVAFLHAMILELAQYERAEGEVRGTVEQLHAALFGRDAVAEAVIAERDGEAIGSAIFYRTFSTWECAPGIWLEDLYVRPADRRSGAGEALLRHVAAIAVQRGYSRFEWVALDWNAPALRFYAKHGAETLPEWLIHRVSGPALRALAAGHEPRS